MKILLCYATAGEWKIIKDKIKNLNLKINLNITYLCTGMWNYETIFNLTKILNNQDFDIVLNIWVCGYVNESKKVIQVARTVNLSTGKELIVPIFLELASMESIGCSEVPVTKDLSNLSFRLKQSWMEKSLKGISRQACLSDRQARDDKEIKEWQYFDMESWWIEYICDKFRIPRVILKVPVDKIGEEVFDKEKASKMLAENLDYGEIIKKLMDYKKL